MINGKSIVHLISYLSFCSAGCPPLTVCQGGKHCYLSLFVTYASALVPAHLAAPTTPLAYVTDTEFGLV